MKVLQTGRKPCGKRRNCSIGVVSPFPTVFSKELYCRHIKSRACLGKGYFFPKQQILDSSKLKDDNFKFDENGVEFSKRVENNVGKGEIAGYEYLLLFP